jgi:uncharacterized protein (TIGR01777 family)
MRFVLTGATGRIGRALASTLLDHGHDVVALSRDGARARESLGIEAHTWQPVSEPAPLAALERSDVVVNLLGSELAKRWTASVKAEICASRQVGTRHLVESISRCSNPPHTLVSTSAYTFYGDRGALTLDESAGPGCGLLADNCVAWEAAAGRAGELGLRVVIVRTGLVLDLGAGGLLATLLPLWRRGLGATFGVGRQYMPWIHIDDEVGILERSATDSDWSGTLNATAPAPVTNTEFTAALEAVTGRRARLRVPARAAHVLYGDGAQIVTASIRAIPRRATELGYVFRYTDIEQALRALLEPERANGRLDRLPPS